MALAVLCLLAACDGDGRQEAGRRAPSPGAPDSPPFLAELPVPRTEVAGAQWRGQLAVAGGITRDGAASDLVHLYDAGAGAWRPAPALPLPLHHAGMAVLDDRLYVAGGYTNGPGQDWRVQARVLSLGPGDDRWREEPPLSAPRGAPGLAAAGGVLVVMGGEANGRPLATTELFDSARRSWRPGPALARPREHLAAAAAGGRVYAIAGRTATGGNFKVVESLDPAGGPWRAEPELLEARGGIDADEVAGRLCVAGGEEPAATIASVECLDGGRWTTVSRLARPRHGLAVVALGDGLHVVAGGERPGLSVSGIHEVVKP